MDKGYQIIELDAIDHLASNLNSRVIAVAVLHWLASEVRGYIQSKNLEVEVEVINVEYLGKYPAVGLHYLNDRTIDIGEEIHGFMCDLVKSRPIFELASFVCESDVSWRKVTDDLFGGS